ncbi:MAG: superoxide dismutase family protein [Deltaproteobacteria bacterium]|nr:superoxide dismutase family protein [Deltaproteobacteria bacterium]
MNWKTPVIIIAASGLGVMACRQDAEPEEPWSAIELSHADDSASTPSAYGFNDEQRGLTGEQPIIRTPAPVLDKRAEALAEAEPSMPEAPGGQLSSQRTRETDRTEPAPTASLEAAAIIDGPPGSQVSGSMAFAQRVGDDAVAVDVKLRGLTPGTHAIYLHDASDCNDVTTLAHVREASEGTAHRGDDLAKVQVSHDGTVETTLTLGGRTLSEGPDSLVGQAVVVDSMPRAASDRRDPVVCALILPSGTTTTR